MNRIAEPGERVRALATIAATLALALSVAVWCGVGTAQAAQSWQAPTEASSADPAQVSVGSHGTATALSEMLGINGTVVVASQLSASDLASARSSARLGVYGTEANENPNPYLANLFYNLYADAKGLSKGGDAAVWDTKNRKPSSFNEAPEEGFGVPADLIARPDIVVGTNTAVGNVYSVTMNHDSTTAVNYGTWGAGKTIPSQPYQYILNMRRHTDDDALVGTMNSDGNEYLKYDEAESAYYRAGDEDFDPIACVYDNGNTDENTGIDTAVGNAGNLARAAERALLQDATRTTRYERPLSIAADFEKYVKASKWYVMKKLAAGELQRKKVAVISGVTSVKDSSSGETSYGFTAVKANADGDSAKFGALAVLEAVQDTTDDLAAECFPNASAGDLGARRTISAEQLMGADVVLCMPGLVDDYTAADVRAALAASGYSDASAYPALFDTTMPFGTFEDADSFSESAEAALLVGVVQGFVYPEAFNSVDMMTYFTAKFFHLKEAYVEPFVKAQMEGVSLAPGVSLATADYSASAVSRVASLLEDGVEYYYANKAAIDAARPRIASTDLLDDSYGVGVSAVSVSVPAGAAFTLADEHDLPLSPDGAGRYVIDDDEQSTLTVKAAGYRTYTRYVTGPDAVGGTISVSLSDLTAARDISFAIPEGAAIQWVKDAGRNFVRENLDGTYTLDAGSIGYYSVALEGFDPYEGTIGASATSIVLRESDFTPESTATKVNVPTGATLAVRDSAGKAVKASSDGTYRLYNGYAYTLRVELERYEPYTLKVTGGESATVNIRRASMTAYVGHTELTIDKAKVTAADINIVDAEMVQKVTLGSKVKTVAASAFGKCAALREVKFGANVTSVGANAFAGCKRLANVTFNTKLTSIGSKAFSGCTALSKVVVPAKVTSIGASAFSGCTSLWRVQIGSGCTSIGASAFAGCTTLRSLTLGAGLKTIGAQAFSGCAKLKSVKLGAKVATIGAQAFAGCKVLPKLIVPASVKSIGAKAFTGCKKLSALSLRTSKLVKAKVKNALSGSSVKTLAVFVGGAKQNAACIAKYKKIFTKANCGRKVSFM